MKAYEVKLDKRDLKVLSENITDGLLREKLAMLIEGFELQKCQTVRFNEAEIDLITDCLSDLFCQRGLLENDEPNAFGYYIENLIDRFSFE